MTSCFLLGDSRRLVSTSGEFSDFRGNVFEMALEV